MTPTESRSLFLARTRWYVAAYFILLSCPAAVMVYYAMFTQFSPWDDEGMMMMLVKDYRSGFRLYDDIFTIYGPVYFFYNSLIRFVTRTAVTHDVTRMTTAVVWLICSLAAAWIVFRFSQSVLVAAVAYVFSLFTLSLFHGEPGHPQELCMLLLLGLAASGLLAANPRRRNIAMILIGAITAALLLTKVNLGAFAMLAVAIAILSQSPVTPFSRGVGVVTAGAALILPSVLMRIHLNDTPTRVYCFVVTASIAALLPNLFRARKTSVLSFRDGWMALASFVVSITAVRLILIAQGVSSYATVYSLLLFQLQTHVWQFWYSPLYVGLASIPWALVGLGVSILFAHRVARETGNAYKLLAPVKLIFGCIALLLPARFLPGFVTPYCWLGSYAPSEDMQSEQAFPRSLLAATAVLQTLYAFPLAGSQAKFINVFLLAVAAVSIGDFLSAARASFATVATSPGRAQSATNRPGYAAGPGRAKQFQTLRNDASLIDAALHAIRDAFRPDRLWLRVSTLSLVLSLPLYYATIAYLGRQRYESMPSLGLRGAEGIHVTPQLKRDFQWLARNLRDNCDTVMGIPDMLSLNFWADKDPPTTLSADNWMFLFNDAQQSTIISALSRHPDACVVYNPAILAFWNRGNVDLKTLPLVRYFNGNFKLVGMVDSYYIAVHKERSLSITPPPDL